MGPTPPWMPPDPSSIYEEPVSKSLRKIQNKFEIQVSAEDKIALIGLIEQIVLGGNRLDIVTSIAHIFYAALPDEKSPQERFDLQNQIVGEYIMSFNITEFPEEYALLNQGFIEWKSKSN